jgi:hypothetical protein
LKEALKLIFESDEKTIQTFFAKTKQEFYKLPISEISANVGVNDIGKWISKDYPYYKSGCPWHVKAAIAYNRNFTEKEWYAEINDGDKLKIIMLRKPNPIREQRIAFPSSDELLSDSGLLPFIDYSSQFDKVFMSPLESLLDLTKWQSKETVSMDSFYTD